MTQIRYNNKSYCVSSSNNAKDIVYNDSTIKDELDKINSIIDEQNKNLGGLSFGKDGDGNYGYYGADGSLIPFKKGGNVSEIEIVTFTDSQQFKEIDVTNIFSNYKDLTVDNFFIKITNQQNAYIVGSGGSCKPVCDWARVSGYNSDTGIVTVYSGLVGHAFTGSGAYYWWATEVKVYGYN